MILEKHTALLKCPCGCKRIVGFVTGSGVVPCYRCGCAADYLCDYPMGDGKICDLPICEDCTTKVVDPKRLDTAFEVGEAFDLCPTHAALLGVAGREGKEVAV